MGRHGARKTKAQTNPTLTDLIRGSKTLLNTYLLAHHLVQRGQQFRTLGNESVTVRHSLLNHLASMRVHTRTDARKHTQFAL